MAASRGHGYVNLTTNGGFRAFYTGANQNNGDNANNGAFQLNGNNDSSNENDNYAARLSSKAPSAKQNQWGAPSFPSGKIAARKELSRA